MPPGAASGRVPAAYLAVVALWSTTPLAIAWSLPGGGYAFSLFARMVVGALCAFALLLASGVRMPLGRGAWTAYAIGGASLFATLFCVYWGAQFVHSGLIALVFGLSPLVTGAVAAVWLRERAFTPLKLFGMGVALLGLGVVFGRGEDLGGPQAPAGLAVLLLAVLLNACGLVGMKRHGAGVPPLATTAGVMLVSLPLFGLVWLWGGSGVPQAMPLRSLLAIIYLGVFGSVLGFALYYYLMKHLPAVSLAMITVVTPVLALVLGSLLNDEALPLRVWAGAACICAGLYLNLRGAAADKAAS
ncbi:DMT family transporter [Thauera linaloolentis]|uniref:EamA domain-containing protein n=1 Tax=Thauera linaloolentis (strain DSM 12138 / JCM 21573 / CCUG 41526 / CIP 105981 / IAM 15112 / NBRC 102519 / 47Lol) TaxID=1123367 RepID=N6Y0R4_THAL4|nr:DMT family transporter [Thauera linaloolentis]ENO85100.1 hypothetical protein C666_16040 [Thauera linaloolentis 47Lol = DSM 12138]MCM8566714.1 DMT family transporter [Thauera linaloolentis]